MHKEQFLATRRAQKVRTDTSAALETVKDLLRSGVDHCTNLGRLQRRIRSHGDKPRTHELHGWECESRDHEHAVRTAIERARLLAACCAWAMGCVPSRPSGDYSRLLAELERLTRATSCDATAEAARKGQEWWKDVGDSLSGLVGMMANQRSHPPMDPSTARAELAFHAKAAATAVHRHSHWLERVVDACDGLRANLLNQVARAAGVSGDEPVIAAVSNADEDIVTVYHPQPTEPPLRIVRREGRSPCVIGGATAGYAVNHLLAWAAWASSIPSTQQAEKLDFPTRVADETGPALVEFKIERLRVSIDGRESLFGTEAQARIAQFIWANGGRPVAGWKIAKELKLGSKAEVGRSIRRDSFPAEIRRLIKSSRGAGFMWIGPLD